MKLPYKLFIKDGEWWASCLGSEKNLGAPARGPLRRLKAKIPDEYSVVLSKFVTESEKRSNENAESKK